LKDEKLGLWVELHSKRLTADKLLDLTAIGFNFIKEGRKATDQKVLGVG